MHPDDNPPPFKKQRRRNAPSEWERVLHQRQKAIALRQQLPLPLRLSTAYRTGSSATPLDTNSVPDEQFQDPALDDDTSLPIPNLRRTLAQGNLQDHNDFPCSDMDRPTGIAPSSERVALSTANIQGSAQNLTEHRDDSWHDSPQGNTQEHIDSPCSDMDRPTGTIPSSERAALSNTNVQSSAQNIIEHGDEPASRSELCGSRHKPETCSDHIDIETLQSMIGFWRNNSALSALCATVGSVRYTVRQYEYSRNHLRDHDHNREHVWPSYYKIRRTFDHIRDRCLPESSVVYLPIQIKPAMREPTNRSGAATIANTAMEAVRVFFPTSWARLDIATSTVFNQMYPDGGGQELDTSSLTLKRHTITDPSRSIFADCDGEAVRCGRGSIIRISAQRSKPNHNTPVHVYESGDHHYFDVRITAVWCVGTEPDLTSSGEMALSTQDIPTNEKNTIKTLLTSRTSGTGLTAVVRPGDICSLLSAERHCEIGEYVPLLIHRYWRSHDGMPSITVVWICPSQYGGRGSPPSPHSENGEAYIVNSVQLCKQGVEENDIRGTQRRLANGTPYFVYRLLLYCDDFQKSSAPQNNESVGGCYFMPLALRPEQRRTTSASRLISLTPPGVSTNDVMHFIVDDLVHGTVCGIWGYTPQGQRVRIFLDVVGFIGDYPASSSVTDVIGHTGRSPCTHCSFRRLHREEAQGSRFGYTTNIHAENSAFLRSAERHKSLRDAGIDSEDATKLGLSQSSIHDVEHWQMNHLSTALQRQRYRTQMSDKGKPVVTGKLDPYRSNFIAPDHLLTSLAKNVLNTVFQSLHDADLQNRVDLYICAALRRNVLLPQRESFRKKKKKRHSMSLSELYCVLLVAGPCFRVATAQYHVQPHTMDAINLLASLQKLVALNYWWPQRDIDGIRAETFMRMNRSAYSKELKRLSETYVRSVNEFCAKNEVGRENLDKQNLHRMLELYHDVIQSRHLFMSENSWS